jgi:metallo-beta-lactamase class B
MTIAGGTRAIVELTGAKTAMGKDDAFILNERTEICWGPEYGADFHETFKLDLPLHDGEILSIGNTEVECVHTPGHTPGSMSFFFKVFDGTRDYTAGIFGSPGLNTLTDEYLARYGLSLDARQKHLASLKKIKSRKVDILLGSHPEYGDILGKRERMKVGKNPFIDVAAWPTFLSNLETSAKEEFGIS